MNPTIHDKPTYLFSYDRLDMLWSRYPQHHEMTTFTTLDSLLDEHESYRQDFEDIPDPIDGL